MTKLDMKTRIFIIISFLLLGSLALATTKYVIQPSGIISGTFDEILEDTKDNLTIKSNRYISIDDSWGNISSPGPSARYMHSMAIDNHNQTIVLFGGSIVYDPFSDTWVYNLTDNTWTQKSPPTSPTGRSRYSMVYDSASDKFILFGGLDYPPAIYLGDTWIYDLAADTWNQMNPSTSPPARAAHSMVYDSNSDRVILFGGNNGTGGVVFNDTWTYSYADDTWTQMMPSNAPSKRWYASMVYDSSSNKTILFGGYDGTSEFDDTWVYDLAADTWTQMNPVIAPTARQLSSMVYDSIYCKVILFGGTSYPVSLNDTWVYDLSTNVWTQVTPSPSPSARQGHSMVFDSTSDQVILFGGANGTLTTDTYFDDTWAYSYGIPLYLLSPEDKTYYVPMSGYYPASFGFDNELHATSGTDLEFIDEYWASGEYVGIGVHDGPIYGHNKVLHIGDAQSGTYTYGVHYFDNPPATGTIEFYNLVDNIHMPSGTHHFHLRATDGTIAIQMRINVIDTSLSNIEYFDGVSWQLISDQVSYKWYHHSISFDCDLGVNGQFTWIVSSENGTELRRVENIEFQNDLNTLDELYLASDVPTYFGATRWDAFGFSWDPNYNVGDNLKRLLLSYNTFTPLDWTGYSLDGGTNVTILGNTTIPMPALGTHTIQVFGNDSAGTYYRSELRSFQIESTIPPSAPLNLFATAGENFVELSWSTPSNDGGSAITQYNIYRGTSSGSYSLLGTTPNTTFNDTTVIGGTTYYYVVTAVNSIGESVFSNEASVTPSTPATAPNPPRNLFTTTGEDSIELSWSTPSSDGGSTITQYNIYRGTSSGSYSFLGNTTKSNFNDITVIAGTTYYYVVTAVNNIGESAFSNEESATPSVTPDTTATTMTTVTTEASVPSISSSPSILIISLFLGILVVFIRKFKKT